MDNIISLRVNDIKSLIKSAWIYRHLKTRPLCIIGHKGIGKTDAVKQACKDLDIECRILNMQFIPPSDLSLPFLKNGTVSHAYSELLPSDGKGILFIDEANRCDKDVRQMLITLLQERKINGWSMGDGWSIVLAMNPIDADGISYEVSEFDAALDDRIAKVYFEGNNKDVVNYFESKYPIEHPVIQWIKSQPQIIEFKGKSRSTPRAIEYLINRLATNTDGKICISNDIDFNAIAVELGKDIATVFWNYLNNPEFIKGKDILSNCNKVLLSKLNTLIEQKRNDILNNINLELCEILSKGKAPNKMLSNLQKYLELINFESQSAFWLELEKQLRDKQGEKDNYESILFSITEYLLTNSIKVKEFFTKQKQLLEIEGKDATSGK